MHPVLEMRDTWTFDDLQALPEDVDWRRYEIVDGALVVSPAPAPLHEYVISQVQFALRSAIPKGYAVIGSSAIDLHPSYRVPDVTVVALSVFASQELLVQPADILLTVEVVSPGSVTTDRITKPAQYAAGGIRAYWRVETDPDISLSAYVLDAGVYREVGSWSSGEIARITDPFAVEITVADLVPRSDSGSAAT
ncbi:MAG TPA: Uma2 family endonuclease [Jatrophihabitans sp.]|jgi:Uma2 family endonuclease|uniref:Uma2 family endonuclease n=1 Tax=Jatrophihabitans sp. TaxID=1932789 RepID=UPI002E07D34D|nr:Uma2 family endonuclease [Jatrophihabitans sp.]